METVGCRTIDATRCGPVAEIRCKKKGKKERQERLCKERGYSLYRFSGRAARERVISPENFPQG